MGPLEQARVETGGADQWVLKREKFIVFSAHQDNPHILGIPTISVQ